MRVAGSVGIVTGGAEVGSAENELLNGEVVRLDAATRL